MNKLSTIKFLVFAMILSFAVTLCEAQAIQKLPVQKKGNGLQSKSASKKRPAKANKPGNAKNSKKQQEANDAKRRKEGTKYIKENKKRSIQIQTPEVQDRMKQNIKDSDSRYKSKKKNNSTRTRKAGKKYR